MKKNIEYFMRKSGVIVRLIDGVILEYLNSEYNWLPNQEWFVSMFVDGEDEFTRLTKEQVDNYINNKINANLSLNSKKMIR